MYDSVSSSALSCTDASPSDKGYVKERILFYETKGEGGREGRRERERWGKRGREERDKEIACDMTESHAKNFLVRLVTKYKPCKVVPTQESQTGALRSSQLHQSQLSCFPSSSSSFQRMYQSERQGTFE